MAKSQVFFANFRANPNENLLQKLRRLAIRAGYDKLDLDGKFVALKIHFGEWGNLAFLRPNYARVIVDLTKEMGGKPFLTDANTLYVGSRKNALDHIETAYANGFNPFVTGCHVIIADGLKGTDETLVPIDGEIGAKVLDSCPYYTALAIPAGTYKGQDDDVMTVTVKATMIISADASEEQAYAVTAAIFDNIDAITAEHAKGAELSIENATSGMTAPFHAGAAKYFKERGVDVETK